MINPTQSDIGRRVSYTGNTWPGGQPEYGVITGMSAASVFVRYDGKQNSEPTSREDLEWVTA